jgi:hypothetical protein
MWPRHRTRAERRRSNGTGTLSNTSLIGQAVAFAPGLLGIGLWIGSLVITTVGELIARGDDRQQEREADRYAVALLLKLGGRADCVPLASAFAKMAAVGGSGSSIGATHPSATERAEEVRRGCAGDATAFVSEGSGGGPLHSLRRHHTRTHLSLTKDAPDGRPVEPPALGNIVPIREVGGLHHRYVRRAA